MPYEHLDCKQQRRSKQNAVALRGSAGFINSLRGGALPPPLFIMPFASFHAAVINGKAAFIITCAVHLVNDKEHTVRFGGAEARLVLIQAADCGLLCRIGVDGLRCGTVFIIPAASRRVCYAARVFHKARLVLICAVQIILHTIRAALLPKHFATSRGASEPISAEKPLSA